MNGKASHAGADSRPRGFLRRGLGRAGSIGGVVLAFLIVACLGSLPWTLATSPESGVPVYNAGASAEARRAPSWTVRSPASDQVQAPGGPLLRDTIGTDSLGRSLFARCLLGGAISLTVGIAAALLSVVLGTAYGCIAGYAGGRTDAVMMRVVDVLYGLPYVLLVVLLAVAVDSIIEEQLTHASARRDWVIEQARATAPSSAATPEAILAADPSLKRRLEDAALEQPWLKPRDLTPAARAGVDLLTLLIAIGGVSWLTMARVIRGQVMSLKSQPLVEAARALGLPPWLILARHITPNLVGPIVVYATLTVPQAILQESFLSFLGIGVKAPLPSWGNLAAEGLSELNPYRSAWWLLAFPCALLATTLLSLNFAGEALREALDPRSRTRG